MIKKFSIISLIFLFFISTVGFPVVINFCSANEDPHKELKDINSENVESKTENISVSFIKEDCCKTELIDKSISDLYLNSDQIENTNQDIPSLLNNYIQENSSTFSDSITYLSGASPPSIINNHIYLDNSILII